MLKNYNRIFIPLLIIFAILTLSVLVNAAATGTHTPVADVTVGVSGATDNSMSNGAVTVTAKGSGGVFGIGASAKTATITVTNSSGSTATISFDWTATSVNELKIDGTKYTTASGSFSKVMDNGEGITITITTAKNGTTNKLVMSNFIVVQSKDSSNVTFDFDDSLGSITVGGSAVQNGDVVSISKDGSELVATAKSGVQFVGWIDTANYKIISKEKKFNFQPADDITIKPVFATTSPWFMVDNSYLIDDLNKAGTTGTIIVLMNNATLPAGNYTIPSGVTLLIPYDTANTLCTAEPTLTNSSYKNPTAYRTLTMAEGANITINGAISVSATMSKVQRTNGSPHGPVGFIKMNNESNITVNGGANLYAWGYIIGSGSVTAKSGSNVYECFQVADWRGGSATSDMVNNSQKVFPISQYYVQNIEVPLIIEVGATENAFFAAEMNVPLLGTQTQKASVPFVGAKDSGCMFPIESGYIIKDYDENTDRLIVDINGTIYISQFKITVKSLTDITLDTNKYVLPLNNYITINVNRGSNVTINQNLALLPGTQLNIDEGATVKLGENNLFVYDGDQWGGYCYTSANTFVPLKYRPTTKYTRSDADLVDAKVLVNGTLDASAGFIYTTESGANVCSSGNGIIKTKIGTATTTYQYDQMGKYGNAKGYVSIAITPLQLKNADDATYVPYSLVAAGAEFKAMADGYWKYITYIKEVSEEGAGTLVYFSSYENNDDMRSEGLIAKDSYYPVIGCSNIPAKASFDVHGKTFYYHSETGTCKIDNNYNITCDVCGNTATFTSTDEKTYTVQFGYFTEEKYYVVVKNEDGNYCVFDNRVVANNQITLTTTDVSSILNSTVKFNLDETTGDLQLRGYQTDGNKIRFFASLSSDLMGGFKKITENDKTYTKNESFDKIRISMAINCNGTSYKPGNAVEISTVYEYLYGGKDSTGTVIMPFYQFIDSYVFSVNTNLAFFANKLGETNSLTLTLTYELLKEQEDGTYEAVTSPSGEVSSYDIDIVFDKGVIKDASVEHSGKDQPIVDKYVPETEDSTTNA